MFLSSEAGDRFGAALADAGDPDGDGVHDLLVGAWRSRGLRGRVELRSGADGRLLRTWRGDHPGDALGWSLAALGDTDGDGVGDLALGAPAGDPPAGSVRIVSGADGRLLREFVGGEPGERFGHALAALGDVDGDGLADLAIGAPRASGGGLAAGRVVVVSGGSGALLWVRQGGAFDHLGQALASPGDVNGDGLADLAVGAPLGDDGAFNGGRVELLDGAGGELLRSEVGDGVGDQLGFWLAGPGDLDGDGQPELAAAAPGDDQGALDGGLVRVSGATSGALLWALVGQVPGEGLGVPAGAGDLNEDGRLDLAVGSPQAGGSPWPAGVVQGGRISLHDGASGSLLGEDWGRRPWGWAGLALAAVEGGTGVVLGAPGHDDLIDLPGAARQVLGWDR